MSDLEQKVREIKHLYEKFREKVHQDSKLQTQMGSGVDYEVDDIENTSIEGVNKLYNYYQKIQEDIEKLNIKKSNSSGLKDQSLFDAKKELLELIKQEAVNTKGKFSSIDNPSNKNISYEDHNKEQPKALSNSSEKISEDQENDIKTRKRSNSQKIGNVAFNSYYEKMVRLKGESDDKKSTSDFTSIESTSSEASDSIASVLTGSEASDSNKIGVGNRVVNVTSDSNKMHKVKKDVSRAQDTINGDDKTQKLNEEFLLTIQNILRHVNAKQKGFFEGKEEDYDDAVNLALEQLSNLSKDFKKNAQLTGAPIKNLQKIQQLFNIFFQKDQKLSKVLVRERKKSTSLDAPNQKRAQLYSVFTTQMQNIYNDYLKNNAALIGKNFITNDTLMTELNSITDHKEQNSGGKPRSKSEQISNAKSGESISITNGMNDSQNRIRGQTVKKARNSAKNSLSNFEAYQQMPESRKTNTRAQLLEEEYFSIGQQITEMYRESIVIPDLKEEYSELKSFFQNDNSEHDVEFKDIKDLISHKSNEQTVKNITSVVNKIKEDYPEIYKKYSELSKKPNKLANKIENFNTKSKALLDEINNTSGLKNMDWKNDSFIIHNENNEPVVELTRKIQTSTLMNSKGKKVKVNSYETLDVPDKVKDSLHLFLPGTTSDGKKLSHDKISGLKVSVHYNKDGNVEELVMPKGIFFDKNKGDESPALIEKDGVLVTFPIKLRDYNAIQRKLGRDQYTSKGQEIAFSISRGTVEPKVKESLQSTKRLNSEIIPDTNDSNKISNLVVPRTPTVVRRSVAVSRKKGTSLL